jgi:hypothetical protein
MRSAIAVPRYGDLSGADTVLCKHLADDQNCPARLTTLGDSV